MPYKPPHCETTGIVIERCVSVKLNGTTATSKDVEVLKGKRFGEQISSDSTPLSNNGLQEAKVYRWYLQAPDEVEIGDKIKFNKSNFWKGSDYDKTILDTIKLEVKQIDGYQISCDGYIEVLAVSYN
jgi:hypothetical protein